MAQRRTEEQPSTAAALAKQPRVTQNPIVGLLGLAKQPHNGIFFRKKCLHTRSFQTFVASRRATRASILVQPREFRVGVICSYFFTPAMIRTEKRSLFEFVHLLLGRPTPYAQTIHDMRKHIGLDDNFEGVMSKVMPEVVLLLPK